MYKLTWYNNISYVYLFSEHCGINTHTLWRTIYGRGNKQAKHKTTFKTTTFNTKTAIPSRQVTNAFKQTTGIDNTNIRHIKRIGFFGLVYLTQLCTFSLTIIPSILKLANIVIIPKPHQNNNLRIVYRNISLLSALAKTLDKTIFLYNIRNIPHITT